MDCHFNFEESAAVKFGHITIDIIALQNIFAVCVSAGRLCIIYMRVFYKQYFTHCDWL